MSFSACLETDAGTTFCDMLLERIASLEEKVRNLARERELEQRSGPGAIARVARGIEVLLYLNESSVQRFAAGHWKLCLNDAGLDLLEHIDEVASALPPAWKGVIEVMRRSSEEDAWNTLTSTSVPAEHRAVIQDSHHRLVFNSLLEAYIKSLFPAVVMLEDDGSCVVVDTSRGTGIDSFDGLVMLYVDILAALWSNDKRVCVHAWWTRKPGHGSRKS